MNLYDATRTMGEKVYGYGTHSASYVDGTNWNSDEREDDEFWNEKLDYYNDVMGYQRKRCR